MTWTGRRAPRRRPRPAPRELSERLEDV